MVRKRKEELDAAVSLLLEQDCGLDFEARSHKIAKYVKKRDDVAVSTSYPEAKTWKQLCQADVGRVWRPDRVGGLTHAI